MDELKKVKRVIQRVEPSAPHEVLLVLDANQGQNALTQATQFHQAVGVTGLVLTKLDGTAKGGIVIAIARKLGIPIRFIGVGEQAEDFGEFDARAFAIALVSGNSGAGKLELAAMISFDNVAKRYPNGREALAGVTFNIQPGEFVFLTGRSGAGKSSVLKLIALLERPTRGTVTVGGQNTDEAQVRQDPGVSPRDRRGVPGSQAAARSARSTTTWRCRWWWPARRSRRSTGGCAPRSTRSAC